jgi:hypothetical protein
MKLTRRFFLLGSASAGLTGCVTPGQVEKFAQSYDPSFGGFIKDAFLNPGRAELRQNRMWLGSDFPDKPDVFPTQHVFFDDPRMVETTFVPDSMGVLHRVRFGIMPEAPESAADAILQPRRQLLDAIALYEALKYDGVSEAKIRQDRAKGVGPFAATAPSVFNDVTARVKQGRSLEGFKTESRKVDGLTFFYHITEDQSQTGTYGIQNNLNGVIAVNVEHNHTKVMFGTDPTELNLFGWEPTKALRSFFRGVQKILTGQWPTNLAYITRDKKTGRWIPIEFDHAKPDLPAIWLRSPVLTGTPAAPTARPQGAPTSLAPG